MGQSFWGNPPGRRKITVTLPPKPGQTEPRTRTYRSEEGARAGQRSAWKRWNAYRHKQRARGMDDFSNNSHWSANKTEWKFVDFMRAVRPKSEVHRGGWPDFLVESDGKIVCVEVKSGGNFPTVNQIRCMQLLEKAGIECYIWQNSKLTRIQRFLDERLGGVSQCLSGRASPQNSGKADSKSTGDANPAPNDRMLESRTLPSVKTDTLH